MKRACAQSWDEIFAGLFHIEIEGWQLVFFNDCGELDYCDECISPDGRRWTFESVVRDGFDLIFFTQPPGTGCAVAASSTSLKPAPPVRSLLLFLMRKPVRRVENAPFFSLQNQWVCFLYTLRH